MSSTRAEAPTHSEIEAIVRVVLQRLRSAQGAPTEHSGTTAKGSTIDKTVEPSNSGSLRLEQPLVTLEHLRDSWHGLHVLQVPARCVVTPAVVDELRLRGVALERIAAAVRPGSTKAEAVGAKLLLLAVKNNQFGLAGQLAGSSVQLQSIEPDSHAVGLAAARQQVASADRYCLWSTSRPFAAMNACSQEAQITAVQLAQVEDLPRAIEEVRPNVIVVDSTRWRPVAIAQLVHNWTRSFAQP